MILVRFLDLKFLHKRAAIMIRNLKSTALPAVPRHRRAPRPPPGARKKNYVRPLPQVSAVFWFLGPNPLRGASSPANTLAIL